MQAAAKAAAEAGSDDEPMGLAGLANGQTGEEAMPDVPSVEAVKQQVDERTNQFARKRQREDDEDGEGEDDLASVPMLQGAGASVTSGSGIQVLSKVHAEAPQELSVPCL